MSESVFFAICLIFALIGIYYVTESLYRYLMCQKHCESIYTLVYHFQDEETLPDKVYSAMLSISYQHFGKREVYVVDTGFSYHIKLRCQLITHDMGKVYFVRREDVKSLYKINCDND